MILYFDTETTGIVPGQICELSYLMQDASGVRAKNFFFSVDSVDYGAYLVHGFSVELLKKLSEGKRFSDDADEVLEDFLKADVVCGHNVAFDLNFMRTECERIGVPFRYKEAFCSMKSTVGVCKLPRPSGGYKYPKLRELCARFSVSDDAVLKAEAEYFGEGSHFHDARFDATATFLCVQACLKEFPKFWGLAEKI